MLDQLRTTDLLYVTLTQVILHDADYQTYLHVVLSGPHGRGRCQSGFSLREKAAGLSAAPL